MKIEASVGIAILFAAGIGADHDVALSGATAGAHPSWPASLKPSGAGYPRAGDPCRRLGESDAVVDHLDHNRILVGCPLDRSDRRTDTLLKRVRGRIVGTVDGVLLISIPDQPSSR